MVSCGNGVCVSERSQVASVAVFPVLPISAMLSTSSAPVGRQPLGSLPTWRRRRWRRPEDGPLHRSAAALHRSPGRTLGASVPLPDGHIHGPSSDARCGRGDDRQSQCLPAANDAARKRSRRRACYWKRTGSRAWRQHGGRGSGNEDVLVTAGLGVDTKEVWE